MASWQYIFDKKLNKSLKIFCLQIQRLMLLRQNIIFIDSTRNEMVKLAKAIRKIGIGLHK